MMKFDRLCRRMALGAWMIGVLSGSALVAQPAAFESGWTLQPQASSLSFQSIKDGTKVESSSFASLEGEIAEDGTATIEVHLESVDTKIDLRNVRMRFLFFETFLYPKAIITTRIDAALLADLPQIRRKVVRLPYELDLHGIKKSFEADVVVMLLGDDQVAVTTAQPISVAITDFNMSEGLAKLEEAAGLPIIPSATVSFDFMFSRNGTGGGTDVAQATALVPAAPVTEGSRAQESTGDFGREECSTRFETLSQSGNIFFGSGSVRLDDKSAPLLNELSGIIKRCPGMVIEVAGHTDSVGGEGANLRLSERRAASVAEFLTGTGIAANRVVSAGFGEAEPVASNDTPEGRSRNRRIEFSIVDQ